MSSKPHTSDTPTERHIQIIDIHDDEIEVEPRPSHQTESAPPSERQSGSERHSDDDHPNHHGRLHDRRGDVLGSGYIAGKKIAKGVEKVGKGGVKVVGSVFADFRNFIDRGNVVDLAVGIVMGAAFTAIVNSFVKDLITPIIGLAVSGSQLENSFVIIRGPDEISCSKNRTLCESIKTIEQAQAVGAVTWNWGSFLQTVINFMIISAIVFLVVKAYTAAFRRRPIKKMKECPFCFRDIPKKAIRCPECTSSLEGLVPKQKEKEKEKARRDSTAPEDGAAETRAKEKESRWKTLKLGKSEKEQV